MDTRTDAIATPGIAMGPKPTYRSPRVAPLNKKTHSQVDVSNTGESRLKVSNPSLANSPSSNKKAFYPSIIDYLNRAFVSSPKNKKALSPQPEGVVSNAGQRPYPTVDEGVLRIWGLRRYEVGGVEVIGWEVGMEEA